MYCKNCGGVVGDFDNVCGNCGATINSNITNAQDASNYTQVSSEPIKTTGLLVWSIIEICCVNIITGIIGLVLWITKLKPAADKGDVIEAKKAKKSIKITLWIGIGLAIITWIGLIISMITAVVLPMASMSENLGNVAQIEIDELSSYIESIETSSDYSDYDYYNDYYYFD